MYQKAGYRKAADEPFLLQFLEGRPGCRLELMVQNVIHLKHPFAQQFWQPKRKLVTADACKSIQFTVRYVILLFYLINEPFGLAQKLLINLRAELIAEHAQHETAQILLCVQQKQSCECNTI